MTFSDKFTTVEEIESWFEDQLQALTNFQNDQRDAVIKNLPSSNSKFDGMSLEELKEYFEASFQELDYLVCFNYLSAVEAHIRMDFYTKLKTRPRNSITPKYRTLYKEKEDKVSLEQDLLEILKEEMPEVKQAFSNFQGALKFRHWIAHGRFWVPKLGMNYNTANILPIAIAALEAIESA